MCGLGAEEKVAASMYLSQLQWSVKAEVKLLFVAVSDRRIPQQPHRQSFGDGPMWHVVEQEAMKRTRSRPAFAAHH